MSIGSINVSTGPVQIAPQVMAALASAPISHRSIAFLQLYTNTTNFLCNQFQVSRCYLLTGSGTAANEAMLWQIKVQGGKGLILSNGEFGERLVQQANRCRLDFVEMKLAWGQAFDLIAIETAIKQNNINWLLFCHCETSTGMMNDLDGLIEIGNQNNCLCFVDCMSSLGTYAFHLSKVAMATASSGKGLASIPGIGIVFSNISLLSSTVVPLYFDLTKYDEKQGIPFTISSNLVYALYVAMQQKLQQQQFALIDSFAQNCFQFLKESGLLPFDNSGSKVFTIALPENRQRDVINQLKNEQLVFSYESEYLKTRGWCQVALLGYFTANELNYFMGALKKVF